MKECYVCADQTSELRPYGPNCSWICFACATATPEATATTEAAFQARLGIAIAGMKAGQIIVLGVGDEGPKAMDFDKAFPGQEDKDE